MSGVVVQEPIAPHKRSRPTLGRSKSCAKLRRFDLFNRLAGWRIYVTNAPPPGSVWTGSELLSSGMATRAWLSFGSKAACWPLCRSTYMTMSASVACCSCWEIALRVLTLTEFVARRDLAATGEKLAGLYAGNPKHATDQPSAERLLKAFDNITLTSTKQKPKFGMKSHRSRPATPHPESVGIPESVYAPPAAPLINSG